MGLEESERHFAIYRGSKITPNFQNPESATIDAAPMDIQLPSDGVSGSINSEELSTKVIKEHQTKATS